MPVFRYKALTSAGVAFQGTYTAAGEAEVVAMLHQQASYPVSVEEQRGSQQLTMPTVKRVKVRDLAIFCRQFYSMLNAGVSIVTCLDILRTQITNRVLRETINQVYEDVQKGFTLSEAMLQHRTIFPNLLIRLVEAGELSGTVDTIMNRTSSYYEREAKMMNRIRTASVYPILLSVFAVLSVTFMLTFVMPTFVSMFESSGVPLPGMTQALISLSNFIRSYWYVIAAVIIGLSIYVRSYKSSPAGRLRIDGLKLRLPIIGGLTQQTVAARFTRTLGTLLASGVPMLQALENVGTVVGNKAVEQSIQRTREDIRRGQPLSVPIQAYGFFPPMVHQMIKVGEESGTLEQLLDKAADFYDDEVETSVQQMTALFEPLMIVVMAVVIGFIVIAMVLPMFDMVKTVQ